MGLFSSRYKALEALADTAVSDRKPEQLAAAQRELEASGLIVVPATDKIKTMAQLDEATTAMETRAKDAEAKVTAAEKRATDAEAQVKGLQAQVAKLQGEAPPDGQSDTPPAGGDAARPGDQDPKAAEQKKLNDEVLGMEHYQLAKRLIGQE